jgi:cytochrome c
MALCPEWRGPGWRGAVLLSLCVAMRAGPSCAADDLAAAQKQFQTNCGVCHIVDPKGGPRQGPNLAGVYGRKAGILPGYKYSAALANAGFVWDDETLDKWIANAQQFRPGAVMPYHQADPAKRKLVILYLKSLGAAQ